MPAATKRTRRAAFDDDDEDGVVVAEASSSLRSTSDNVQAPRKKVRVSMAGPSKASSAHSRRRRSDASSDEEETMQEAEAHVSEPPATQYELLRDDGFRHLDHSEEDDQRATQRLQNRDHPMDNLEAFNAVLESITCFNFMCHEHLHCELGPLLNFIVGENGSGKSAILTAITLCLGGKASSTNRGASLKSFIKEGQDNALLRVKIKNRGTDAYQPDKYGDTITVERRFTRGSGTGFRLKSDAGQTISTKKADVDDVVEYYCLQVDNPLNILSQDNARQFLNAASPSTKYRYFLQGTQLEQLDNDLKLYSEYIESTELKLVENDENLQALKERYDKAKAVKKTISQNADLRAKARLYVNQLAWSQVQEQEVILEEKENAIAAAEEEIQNLNLAVEQATEKMARQDEKVQAAKQALEEIREGEAPLQDKVAEAEAKFKAEKGLLEQLHIQQRDIKGQMDRATKQVSENETKLRVEKERLEEANGGALATKQKELDDAKQAVVDIKTKLQEHDSAGGQLQEDFVKAEKDAQDATAQVEQKRTEIRGVESRIRSVQNHGDKYAAYPPRIPQLLRLIDEDRGFHHKPIGPLGSYISLSKPEWSTILEATLGGHLNSFIVGDVHDQRRLRKHMDRLVIERCNVNIRGPQARLNNVKEPDESFETILRVLKFDDERVKDMLVLVASIEQILLHSTKDESDRVMYLNGQPPENVTASICHAPRKRGEGLRSVNRGGSLGYSPIKPDPNQKPRLKSDAEAQINLLKETLSTLQSELRDLDAEKRRLAQAAQKCSQAVASHKRLAKNLDRDLRQAEVVVENTEAELDKFEDVDVRLISIGDALQKAKEQQEHFGQQYGTLTVDKEEKNKAAQATKAELKHAKDECADYAASVGKAEEKVKRYESVRRVMLQETNDAHEQLEVARIKRQDAEGSRDRQLEHLNNYVRQATEVCAERCYLPAGETHQSIERKYEGVTQQIKKIRERNGKTDDQINKEFSEAHMVYDEAKRAKDNMTNLMIAMKKALTDRLDKWRYFQRMISAHARSNFSYLLSERGFRGKLLLDHRAKKLDIKVEPDETRKNVSGRNTKTLSGGEKSFSSICLLLAIWDAMGSPLRCLDEFDVFMDNVNRAISTNMLIQAARRSVGKQFILITPNAIEGRAANIDKDVKIIRLTDPRQKTLTNGVH